VALQQAPAAAVPPLEPAVVVSRPEEHTHGPGVLIEAVGPDGKAVYACEGCQADQLEEAIEAAIQEARRHLVQHVRPTDEELGP
jgi:hypothetical protein